jgi:hypothetical protein
MSLDERITPDEAVHVIALPRTVIGFVVTPEGEEALDLAQQGREIIARVTGQPTEAEPTMAIPPSVCDRARKLAQQRRSPEIPEPRRPLL